MLAKKIVSGPFVSSSIIISNRSPVTLSLSDVDLAGEDAEHFRIISDSGESSLLSGGTRVLLINFEPVSTGQKSADVLIHQEGIDVPIINVSLVGAGSFDGLPQSPMSPTPADTATGVVVWSQLEWAESLEVPRLLQSPSRSLLNDWLPVLR